MSEIRKCEVCGEEFYMTHLRCGDCAGDIMVDADELRAEIARLNEYIIELENEPIRSKSVIKRLRAQTIERR